MKKEYRQKNSVEFNGIYMNVTWNSQSDANEVDVLAKVLQIYKAVDLLQMRPFREL